MCLTLGFYLVGKIVFLSRKIWEKPGESQGKDQGKFREKLGKSREFLKVMSMATMCKSIKSCFTWNRPGVIVRSGCNIQCNVDYVGTSNIILCLVLSGLGKGHEIPL